MLALLSFYRGKNVFFKHTYILPVDMWGKRRFVASRAKAKFKLFPLLLPPPPFFLHCRRKSIKKSWAWGRGRPAAGPSSLRNTHSPTLKNKKCQEPLEIYVCFHTIYRRSFCPKLTFVETCITPAWPPGTSPPPPH